MAGSKYLLKNLLFVFFLFFVVESACYSGSMTGDHYSNFGHDLSFPIFPKEGKLDIYEDQSAQKILKKIENTPVVQLRKSDVEQCVKKNDIWVKCRIKGTTGWVKRSAFLSADEIVPVQTWPFRYWLNVAGDGGGTEDNQTLFKAVKSSPYLIKPKDFENVFFLVYFDKAGFAVSPKNGKKTGDRVFLVDDAIYLAPDAGDKRMSSGFLFLNYYNEGLQAICPGRSKDSCYSAVNLSKDWPGIKELHTSPGKQFIYDEARQLSEEKDPWFGAEEVAFGRHTDTIVPFLYRVPESVAMKTEIAPNRITDEERKKNRSKLFCLLDCNGNPEKIKSDPMY